MAEIEVDARRLLCPLPVIRLQEAVSNAQHGDMVHLHCTDPGARNDVSAWCSIHQQKLMSQSRQQGTLTFVVQVCKKA